MTRKLSALFVAFAISASACGGPIGFGGGGNVSAPDQLLETVQKAAAEVADSVVLANTATQEAEKEAEGANKSAEAAEEVAATGDVASTGVLADQAAKQAEEAKASAAEVLAELELIKAEQAKAEAAANGATEANAKIAAILAEIQALREQAEADAVAAQASEAEALEALAAAEAALAEAKKLVGGETPPPPPPAPNPGTVVDVIGGNSALTLLLNAIQTAGLADQLNGVGPFTVFAPSDAALNGLGAAELAALLADPTKLAEILGGHVVAEKLMAADLFAKAEVMTIGGSTLAVDATTETVGGAMVSTPDIPAGNGVIHIIEMVLMPAAANG